MTLINIILIKVLVRLLSFNDASGKCVKVNLQNKEKNNSMHFFFFVNLLVDQIIN